MPGLLRIEKRRTEVPRTLGLFVHRCCEDDEVCTSVKELCQMLGITMRNLNKLREVEILAYRILVEAFRDKMRCLDHAFDYIFMNKGY